MKAKVHEHQKKYLRVSKKVAFLIAFICLSSCKCKKSTAANETVSITSECPKDGTCTVTLLKNKNIAIQKDELGKLYYTLEDNASKSVYHYIYKRTVKGDIQDASYREEVILEMDNNPENPTISGNEIKDQQALFARFCYCKGQTGYYKIKQGTLDVSQKADGKTIDLNFKIDEVPQIIKHVSFSVK